MLAEARNGFLAIVFPALLLAGCGGGESSGPLNPPGAQPPGISPPPPVLRLDLMSGTASVDEENCQSVNGPVDAARFSRLLRATATRDALYLAETGEGCRNTGYENPVFVPRGVLPAIRKMANGRVETEIELHSYFSFMSHPVMVRYPSGFLPHESGQGGMVLAYAAARSSPAFSLDEQEVSRYTAHGGWNYYVPGLFSFRHAHASYDDLVAGAPGQPPALADGQGHAARFVAPHDLERDAAGVMYVIDQGRIRTIDRQWQVRSLDHAALGITGTVKALDSDLAGHIHVLAQQAGGRYSWHRLKDGSRLDFSTREGVFTEPVTAESFAVTGEGIVLAIRLPSGASQLYRVSARGEVRELTGQRRPATPQDFLERPSEYLLPAVQHLEYGPDKRLYIVLPQGVLLARHH